jgi:hypothetical protein
VRRQEGVPDPGQARIRSADRHLQGAHLVKLHFRQNIFLEFRTFRPTINNKFGLNNYLWTEFLYFDGRIHT